MPDKKKSKLIDTTEASSNSNIEALQNSAHALHQNPHAIRKDKENKLEVAIGRQVHVYRKQLGITISDLAKVAGISRGMMSKIENGMTSPSLTTLQQLSIALGVPVSDFFRRFEQQHEALFVNDGEGLEIERRGSRAGHQYSLLGYTNRAGSNLVVEPYLITLSADSDAFPDFQHSGLEFLYMLEGKMSYQHGPRRYVMEKGDSLFFDSEALHGPKELIQLPVRFLSIISYTTSERGQPDN